MFCLSAAIHNVISLVESSGMNEKQIRNAFRRRLQNRYQNNPETLIVDEMVLNRGDARADLVVVTSTLHGFELKGDNDNLNRLSYQVDYYNWVFDKVTIVVTNRNAYKAARLIPDWWGITLADYGLTDDVEFTTARQASKNPKMDKSVLVKLLWREEAVRFLSELGNNHDVRKKTKDELYHEIITSTDASSLSKWICRQLRIRQGWPTASSRILSDD